MKGKDIFRENLGIKVLEVKDGYAKLSLQITKNHTNSIGTAHGGAIFALADCAFAEAANFGENIAVAVQVSINFMKPAFEGDILTAEAVRVSEGRTLGFYHVTIFKEDKKIAFFSGLAFKT
ncbi:MAG: hotdog fold thioesterase [Candidatus Bathyarchaeota archaeon]|nr:hotdog fold thioesterase [Candidatus Bathyarchaeota archaeon]